MANKSFTLEKGKYGKSLVLLTSWSDEIKKYMIKNNIKELELNYAKGWKKQDLSFLKEIDFLEAFTLIDNLIENIEHINYLKSLKYLQISTYCKTEIDFTNYNHLEECRLRWRPKAKSLFKCKTIRVLFLNNYSMNDLTEIAKLHSLISLSVANSPIKDIKEVGILKKLNFLGLYNLSKLDNFNGIEELSDLETFEIEGCRKIGSIKGIEKLHNLRSFILTNNGDIDSIKSLENIETLERFMFCDSTNILDGDLAPLKKIKNLKKVLFKDRKHYTHKRKDFN